VSQEIVSIYYYISAIQEFYTGKKTNQEIYNINAYQSANIQ